MTKTIETEMEVSEDLVSKLIQTNDELLKGHGLNVIVRDNRNCASRTDIYQFKECVVYLSIDIPTGITHCTYSHVDNININERHGQFLETVRGL